MRHEEKLNLSLDSGTLVDLETNEGGEPITIGLVKGNRLNIFQLLNDDPATVDLVLKSIAEGMEFEEPLIAFNVSFEKSVFEGMGMFKVALDKIASKT